MPFPSTNKKYHFLCFLFPQDIRVVHQWEEHLIHKINDFRSCTTQMDCESHHTTTQMPHHNHTSVRIVQDLINKSGKKLDKFGLCPKSGGGQQKNTKC